MTSLFDSFGAVMTPGDSRLDNPPGAVVITGGASGIGLASARLLADAGRPVALWDLSAEAVVRAAEDNSSAYGVPAVGLAADLRVFEAAHQAAAASRAAVGPIGGLVHAAGVCPMTGLAGVTAVDWDGVLNVHLRALVASVQALSSDLRAATNAAIVAIASINAHLGAGAIPAYTAAKGGVISLVRSLADELGQYGIRVNSVSPGLIETPMLYGDVPPDQRDTLKEELGRRIFLGRLGQAGEVGRVVRFLLSQEASYITAADIVVDGGNIPSQRA